MPVLKDIECTVCERTVEMLLDGECEEISLVCHKCGQPRLHRTICAGGVKVPTFGEGNIMRELDKHVEVLGCKAGHPRPEHVDTPLESKTARPDTFYSKHANAGQAVHDMPRWKQDALSERREQRKSKRKRKLGINTLTFGPTK